MGRFSEDIHYSVKICIVIQIVHMHFRIILNLIRNQTFLSTNFLKKFWFVLIMLLKVLQRLCQKFFLGFKLSNCFQSLFFMSQYL